MTERNIYALIDVPPETQAYALARYSRSAASMRESIAWITGQKASDFLETFYFAYGHKSIADMAHITMALENISVLAAIEVEDEPLWDGQERSTRYQDFTKSSFIIPPEIKTDPAAAELFSTSAEGLFNGYSSLTRQLFAILSEVLPRPDAMDPGSYRRTLNARVLDVTRSLLPYATRTSVGQITSARVLERQISRLLSSPYAEIKLIAAEMKEACKQPGFSPLAVRMEALLKGQLEKYPEARPGLEALAGVVNPEEPAPTLVKYAAASAQREKVAGVLQPVVKQYLGGLIPDNSRGVVLVDPDPPLIEAVTTLLYRQCHLAYIQVQEVVRDLSPAVRQEIYNLAHQERGPHDEWLREQYAGYGRIFDMLLDAKSMQDFFRHRRAVQIRQEITARHGFEGGKEWFKLGLPEKAAVSAVENGLAAIFDAAIKKAAQVAATFDKTFEKSAGYLLPLGFKRRALFKMDDAQAAYMIETRSGVNGHFAYRQAAFQMWQELERQQPELARWIKVTPFEQIDYLVR